MRRRRLLGLAGAAAAALAGCGFRPRRPLALPFERLALVGFAPRSALEAELRRSLPAGVRVVDVPAEAQVVLTASRDTRDRGVVATTAAGQVRELQLRLHVVARADTPDGRALMPPTELRLVRELSYTEAAALAKAREEEDLFREMQSDVVSQLLRRLAAVRP